MDEINDLRREILHEFMQKVSYDVGDLIMRAPRSIRPAAVAIIQACLSAEISTMSQEDHEKFEAVLKHVEIVTLPTEMDPRKNN